MLLNINLKVSILYLKKSAYFISHKLNIFGLIVGQSVKLDSQTTPFSRKKIYDFFQWWCHIRRGPNSLWQTITNKVYRSWCLQQCHHRPSSDCQHMQKTRSWCASSPIQMPHVVFPKFVIAMVTYCFYTSILVRWDHQLRTMMPLKSYRWPPFRRWCREGLPFSCVSAML